VERDDEPDGELGCDDGAGLSPADGETVADTTPELSWDTVNGAEKYEVQVADSETGVADATVVEVTEAAYTPTSALTNNEIHYWRVRAVGADGQPTAWSSTTSLAVSWGAREVRGAGSG